MARQQQHYDLPNRQVSDSDNDGTAAMDVVAKFMLILFLVILPLEVLMLSQGYTFTPWFFFLFFLSCCRQTASPPSSTSSSNNNNLNNSDETVDSRARRILQDANRRDRVLVPTTDENDIEVPGQVEVDGSSVEPIWSLDTTDDKDGANKNPSNAVTKEEFSLLGPSSGRRILKKKVESKTNSSSTSFRKAVDQAHFKTTEVDSKALSKKYHIVKEDPIDGMYEIEYELVGKADKVVVRSTLDLKFVTGFCGWNIMGSRPAPSISDNHGYGVVTGDGEFHIQRGFLAKTGNIYWEERGAFVPSFSVLVGGTISPTSSFSGHWLSSSSTDGEFYSGKVIKFSRLCQEEEDKEDQLDDVGEIV